MALPAAWAPPSARDSPPAMSHAPALARLPPAVAWVAPPVPRAVVFSCRGIAPASGSARVSVTREMRAVVPPPAAPRLYAGLCFPLQPSRATPR
eukprot:6442618-Alexandrium_andersonii.AAC.1